MEEDGEILARTAKAMSGYWNLAEQSAAAVRDGWLLTGDGGTYTDGALRVTDRKKDVIVSGGENVSSLEVEAVLHQHPTSPTPPSSACRTTAGADAEGARRPSRRGRLRRVVDPPLLQVASRRLQVPTSAEQRDELPRTATGKAQEYVLRAPCWS